MLKIHENIKDKLYYFHKIQKIPNIIFYGPSGSGKKTIVYDFINKIYNNDKEKMKEYLNVVNCSQGKGIKFIRDDLKFFAKTHINSNCGNIFKSILLLNADKLTIDAQSALRRCIELFSHNTRFFIIVEDKYKLLKPIISRFCEIYIPEPFIKGNNINLYSYNLNKLSNINKKYNIKLKKIIDNNENTEWNYEKIIYLSNYLYDNGYAGLDIIDYIENNEIKNISYEKKNMLLITFNMVKKEIKSEKLLILFMLNFLYMDKENQIKDITL